MCEKRSIKEDALDRKKMVKERIKLGNNDTI